MRLVLVLPLLFSWDLFCLPVHLHGSFCPLCPQSADSDLPPSGPLPLQRQATFPSLKHGDVLLVELVGAKRLPSKGLSGLDVFASLSLGGRGAEQLGKSSLRRGTVSPSWQEQFGFHLAPISSS